MQNDCAQYSLCSAVFFSLEILDVGDNKLIITPIDTAE